MKASTATAPSAATYLRRALRVRSTTTTTNATVLSLLLLAILATMTLVRADVYLHNPRGSNNRLNENGDNRNNANRMFDSQNNNKGGYNVGDRGTDAFETNAPLRNNLVPAQTLSKMYDASYRDMDRQGNTGTTPTANTPYPMVYLEGSILPVEWTNQHGCGGHESNDPSKTNCDIIMQYMCETGYGSASANPTIIRGAEELRDGYNTGTPDTVAGYKLVMQDTDGDSNRNNGRGRHESEMYYYECTRRSRNQGLFTADQNLGGNTAATRTRQNPNGGRSGLECPEERDYYPYWNPSPWRDIVILTDHPELMCNADGTFKGASQNNVEVSGCFPTLATTGAAQIDTALSKITQTQCSSATGAQWMTFKHNLPAPGCMKAPYSRSNHLGNGENGTALTYSWSLPMISTLRNTGVRIQTVGTQDFAKCVFRLRYNISTDDYNPYTTGSEKNGADKSPVTTDPTIDIGSSVANIKLDVDTAQFGRVFQDRSHTFYIVSRPTAWASRTIYNLNIRGRRGNIVQVYPAVEYDFVPRTTTLQGGDLVHIQWTGSNTSPDGAGQGATNTDRNNFAQMLTYGDNYPLPYDRFPDNIFSRSTCYMINGTTWGTNVNDQTPDGVMGPRAVDCALFLWTSGYFLNKDDYLAQSTRSPNVNLDKAPASLVGGIVMEIRAPAVNTTYPILSSRNNAFSNRAEKGWIIASP